MRSDIDRRRLLLAAGGLAAVSPRLRAQIPSSHRILWLSVFTQSANAPFFNAFVEGLAALGYAAGRNLTLDARWGDNSSERLDHLAREAMALKPAVIVTQGPAVHAARQLDGSTPVVIAFSGDPVELGIAKSLGRPGGRFTGVTMLSYDLAGKRVELLQELAPRMKRLAVLSRPDHPGDAKELEATREAAARFGLNVGHFPAGTATALQSAFAGIAAMRADSMVVHPDGFFLGNRNAIARFCIEQRIPSASGWADHADAGMLLTYGPNREDIYRRLAYFVDRILRGTSPKDLPIELPTRIELVVNVKTARLFGMAVPQTIVVRSDRLIE